MLSYGCLPDAFMRTSIIPILINKNGDTRVKSNYRPIAIVTAKSKIFKLCLSRIIDVYLIGFKQKHSIDVCIYTVKSIIQYHSSTVYICFLYASEAFDRIKNWTMCKQLMLTLSGPGYVMSFKVRGGGHICPPPLIPKTTNSILIKLYATLYKNCSHYRSAICFKIELGLAEIIRCLCTKVVFL